MAKTHDVSRSFRPGRSLLYGTFTFLTAFAWDYTSMMVLRFVTAIGVGAEYAAINAAISEFIPARHRGKTHAAMMNFWSIGAILAALVTLLLINQLPTGAMVFPWRRRRRW